MTLKEAKAKCHAQGMVLSMGVFTEKSGIEYRIAPDIKNKELAEELAYYTRDIRDAVDTAIATRESMRMAREFRMALKRAMREART